MAWQDEMDVILRTLVGDLAGTTYADDNLEQILVVSGRYVMQEMSFSQNFVCSAADVTITPDPTDDVKRTRDDSFVNLTCLKAACLLDHSSAVLAASQAISVKDGNSAIDLRGKIQGLLQLLEKGWCYVYDEARLTYQTGTGVAGAAVMGPFRLFAQGYYGHPNVFDTARDRPLYL